MASSRKKKLTGAAEMQAKTLKNAHRLGIPWDDSEVGLLARAIEKDETTFEIAMRLGRSYYGVNGARQHVRFAMNHANAIWGGKRK